MRYLNLVKNISNWWLHFAVKWNLCNVEPLIFKTRGGVQVEVPRRLLHEFKEIFLDNAYFTGLKSTLPAEPTVLDVGANAGFFSLCAASRFPGARIFSFEPVPVNFKQLQRNKNLNSAISVTCIPEAVSGQTGEIFLHFDTEDSFTTSATIFSDKEQGENGLSVNCTTLEKVFNEHGITSCDLLKLDCEGAEFEILYNCPQAIIDRIQHIVMEVHEGAEKGQNINSLSSFLKSVGFVVMYEKQMLWAWRPLV